MQSRYYVTHRLKWQWMWTSEWTVVFHIVNQLQLIDQDMPVITSPTARLLTQNTYQSLNGYQHLPILLSQDINLT